MLVNFHVDWCYCPSLLLFLLLLVLSTAVVVSGQCFRNRISPGLVTRGDIGESFEIFILVLHGVGTLTQRPDELSQFEGALLQLQLAVGGEHEIAGLADGASGVPKGDVG